MGKSSRLVLAAVALSLAVLYVTPMWHIGLRAPQYPEGLGLYIWIDRITGQAPNDLRNINGLNHYVGMKPIEPENIPELSVFPVAVGVLAAAGLLVALAGRRWALYTWVAGLGIGMLVGLADFWRWGYRYGHDLDPHAAIRVPGLSYQPPLFGTKQLLNFQATSWPALGGWVVLAGFGLASWLVVREWRRARGIAG